MQVKYISLSGQDLGTKDIDDALFAQPVKLGAVYEALKNENANLRLGGAKTRNRKYVSGGGIKPWRQKGTGNARQGSIRAPQWRGGGTVHGPQPKSFTYAIPKQVKRAAIAAVLAGKAAKGEITVVKGLQMNSYSTKTVAAMLKAAHLVGRKNFSLILADDDKFVKGSAANIGNLETLHADRLSVRGALLNQGLLIAEEALAKLVSHYAGARS